MNTCFEKSCLLGLLCVSFVYGYQLKCVLLSLLVLRVEFDLRVEFLIIAFLFPLS